MAGAKRRGWRDVARRGQPGGTRARWARGHADARALRADGSASPVARGWAAWRHAGAAGGQPASPPAQLARTTQIPPPARLTPRRRPPGACPATPDTPQRAPGSPTYTQLPSEYPGGASDSPARTRGGRPAPQSEPDPQRAPAPPPARTPGGRQAPRRAPGEHPRRAPNPRRVWLPAGALWAHAQPSSARTRPSAHSAPQRAPASPMHTWRTPAPRLFGQFRHGLRSLRPPKTRFWPFSPRFTPKRAPAMRKPQANWPKSRARHAPRR